MNMQAAQAFAQNLNTAQNARAAGAGAKLAAMYMASRSARNTARATIDAANERARLERQLGEFAADQRRRVTSAGVASGIANAQGVSTNTGTPLNALVEFARQGELAALMDQFSFEVNATDIVNKANITAFALKDEATSKLGAGVVEAGFTFADIGRSETPTSQPTSRKVNTGRPLPSRSPALVGGPSVNTPIRRTSQGRIIGGI